jgi:hypothetical protein
MRQEQNSCIVVCGSAGKVRVHIMLSDHCRRTLSQGTIFTPTSCGDKECSKHDVPLVAKVMCEDCAAAFDEVRAFIPHGS